MITWGAKDGLGGMKDRYLVGVLDGRTGGDWRGLGGGRVLLIKQENPDQRCKVLLLDMPAKFLE